MTDAIMLAFFCAAIMDLLGTACLRAFFTTMSSFSADGEHARLGSTTTSRRAITVRTPTAHTVNWASSDVAWLLLLVSVTMFAIRMATLVSIDEFEGTSHQTTATFSGAF